MTEIAAIWILVSRIGDTLEDRGRKTGFYKLLAVVLWFAGELMGVFVGSVVVALMRGEPFHTLEELPGTAILLIYVGGIIGAVVGGGSIYLCARSLPSLIPEGEPTRTLDSPLGLS